MPQPPSRQPGDTESTPPTSTTLWFMLLALLSAFALSQAYRTVTAIMATQRRWARLPACLACRSVSHSFSWASAWIWSACAAPC